MRHRTDRYVVSKVKRKIEGIVKMPERTESTAEAIPLYADWIPQANGFAASPVNPQTVVDHKRVPPGTVDR